MEFNQKVIQYLLLITVFLMGCGTDDEIAPSPDEGDTLVGVWNVMETLSQYDANNILLSSSSQQSRLTLAEDQETGTYEYLPSGGKGEIVYHYFKQSNKVIMGQIFPIGENTITTVFDITEIREHQMIWERHSILRDPNGDLISTVVRQWALSRQR